MSCNRRGDWNTRALGTQPFYLATQGGNPIRELLQLLRRSPSAQAGELRASFSDGRPLGGELTCTVGFLAPGHELLPDVLPSTLTLCPLQPKLGPPRRVELTSRAEPATCRSTLQVRQPYLVPLELRLSLSQHERMFGIRKLHDWRVLLHSLAVLHQDATDHAVLGDSECHGLHLGNDHWPSDLAGKRDHYQSDTQPENDHKRYLRSQ